MARPEAPLHTVLLTGFEPFGGEAVNPSWLIAQALHGQRIGSQGVIVAQQLPCVFGRAQQALRAALAEHRPLLVLALGQAAGRCDLSVERIAINVDDARIPDNAGASPIDEPVLPGGPAAYFSTLPIKAMVAAMREAGLPASVSQTAGTFVCNHVFYALMHALQASKSRRPAARGGFMHVPLLPEQAVACPGQPSLPLATLVQGTRVALAAALRVAMSEGADLRVAGGSVA